MKDGMGIRTDLISECMIPQLCKCDSPFATSITCSDSVMMNIDLIGQIDSHIPDSFYPEYFVVDCS